MVVKDIIDILEGEVICEGNLDHEIKTACGSDMMSDVLAFVKDQGVLITGLVNTQVIRTAAMMDMRCIVFVRGKEPGEDVLSLASGTVIVIMRSDLRMYEACGRLYNSGLHAGSITTPEVDDV